MKMPCGDILACPVCKGKLSYQHTTQMLICQIDQLGFAVTENKVPVMCVDAAILLSKRDVTE